MRPPSEGSDLERILDTLRRRWKILFACIILAGAGAFALSTRQQKQYTASASLLFRDTQFDQELFGSNFQTGNVDPAQQQATNLDLASLPVVGTLTGKALHLPGGLISTEVSVAGVGQANIAQINVTDPSPERAAKIANAYAQQYVLYRQNADRSKIVAAQQLVKHELASLPPSQRKGSVGINLENRANQIGALAALQTGNAEVAQPATVPDSPSKPNVKRATALGLLLGLLLGIALMFVRERLDKRIRSISELEDIFGLPLLGAIPESEALERAGREPLPHVEAEAFALLRARLRYFNVDREVRSLLMTSSQPAEGKTTTALNLAIAEAVAGNPAVVLLEADLRRPSLAARLGLSPGPGLAEILSHNATLESAIQEVPVPGMGNDDANPVAFALIPAGVAPPNPAELLESRTMIDLVAALSERYNLVIIDTAPTMAVSDAIPLMRLVNGVIAVNRLTTVTRDAARALRDHLAKLRAPVLGIVANGLADKKEYQSEYGYVYGYHNPYIDQKASRRGKRTEDSAAPVATEAG